VLKSQIPYGMAPSTSSPKWTINQTLEGHKGSVHVAVYSTGGQHLLTGGQDRTIKLWNPTKGSLVQTYEAHGWEVLGLVASHDNSRFASCGGDRTVFYWDVNTGQTIKRFQGHSGRVNAVAFNFESTVLASGSYDATVRLWDLKSQQRMPIQVLSEAKDSVTSLSVIGTNIVTASVDGHVRWYDLRKGELRTDYFDQPVTSVTLTADSQSYLASTLDSKLRLMDSEDGQVLQTFLGHRNTSYRIKSCFGFAESTVMTGDENGQLFVWSLELGSIIWSGRASEKSNKAILWTDHHPTKDTGLVTAGSDGLVSVWVNDSNR